MEIINLSGQADGQLYDYLPHNLQAEKVVFFPDTCPGKSPLPTGTATHIAHKNWQEFTLSDIGCGMMLVASSLSIRDFHYADWDRLIPLLKGNKNCPGDIGSGNHFLMAYADLEQDRIYFLIHTGSRLEGKEMPAYVGKPNAEFIRRYQEVVSYAEANRLGVYQTLVKVFGPGLKIIFDRIHNSFEYLGDNQVIVRKGTVAIKKGEETIIPSHMGGEAVVVKATEKVDQLLNSLNHGTGRKMSRGEAKEFSDQYNYEALRQMIYIPRAIPTESIRTESPFCYRELDDCLTFLSGYVTETLRLSPLAYIGQL